MYPCKITELKWERRLETAAIGGYLASQAFATIQEAESHPSFGETGLGLPKELFQRYANACRALGFRPY